jgi:hypothetical protein
LDITQPNRIALPGGAWADLRPAGEITERLRRPIKKLGAKLASYPEFIKAVEDAQAKTADGSEMTAAQQLQLAAAMGDAFDVLEELQDRLVVAAVRGWSYGSAITVDALLDLPSAALDALREVAAPYQSALSPDFTPNQAADSPIAPSNA